jgi:hypothetical protein
MGGGGSLTENSYRLSNMPFRSTVPMLVCHVKLRPLQHSDTHSRTHRASSQPAPLVEDVLRFADQSRPVHTTAYRKTHP